MASTDIDDSIPLELADLKRRLQGRAQRKVKAALAIQVCLLAGFKRAEIQAKLGLSDDDYSHAARWLREEAAATRRQRSGNAPMAMRR